MKRILLLLCVGCCLTLNAEKRIIKETFDESDNKMGWSEFSEKKASALIQDGYYVITQKATTKKSQIKFPMAELPINVHNNFKVSFKFWFEKFSKKNFFAVGSNNAYFMFWVDKLFPIVASTEETSTNNIDFRKGGLPIILKKGKNKEVLVEWEKKGRKTIISVDGMEVYTTEDIVYSSKVFFIQDLSAQTLKVDEVIIEQRVDE